MLSENSTEKYLRRSLATWPRELYGKRDLLVFKRQNKQRKERERPTKKQTLNLENKLMILSEGRWGNGENGGGGRKDVVRKLTIKTP